MGYSLIFYDNLPIFVCENLLLAYSMNSIRFQVVSMTALCTLMHFLVDGLCICCLYLLMTPTDGMQVVKVFAIYNILAFLTQPLTGYWADRIKDRHWILLGAALLLTAAVLAASLVVNLQLTVPVALWGVAVLLGLGNSLFHVWGGKQTAMMTGNDIRALGVFVSSGAFGLAVGGVFCSWPLLFAFLIVLCLSAVCCLRMEGMSDAHHEEMKVVGSRYFSKTEMCLFIIAIMAFVMGRSLIGETFVAGITKNSAVILLIGAVSMLGKMAGGWIAKAMGIVSALILMLMAVIACFLWGDSQMPVLLAGLFFINCTMPITLYWANVVLKGREGLAFGLLAAALMPGFLLSLL